MSAESFSIELYKKLLGNLPKDRTQQDLDKFLTKLSVSASLALSLIGPNRKALEVVLEECKNEFKEEAESLNIDIGKFLDAMRSFAEDEQ
jgi:hypothetical protein